MLEAALLEQVQRASVVEVRPAPARVATTPGWARPVTSECVVAEAGRQQLELLKVLAVLKTENGRVGQFVPNSNGSYDIGPMQVNTIHLPELAKTYGVAERTMATLLAYDGCFNVAVGTWLLRRRTNEAGGDFWYGIGRYHSKTTAVSTRYILRVHGVMTALVKGAANTAIKQPASAAVQHGAALVAFKGD